MVHRSALLIALLLLSSATSSAVADTDTHATVAFSRFNFRPDDVLHWDLPCELVVIAVLKKEKTVLENTEDDPNGWPPVTQQRSWNSNHNSPLHLTTP